MSEHPIEGLMTTAMNSIQDMSDVNTIIGEPIETSNNIIIIPISKVTFGFGAGGSEFKGETIDEYKKVDKEEQVQYRLPFGGGAGAGVSINPVSFLVITENNVKLMPVNHSSSIDKLLDYVPDLMEKTNNMLNKFMQDKKEQTNKIINKINRNPKDDFNKKIEKDIKDIEEQIANKQEDMNVASKSNSESNENLGYEYEYNEIEDE